MAGVGNNMITLPNVPRKKDAVIVKVPIERGIECLEQLKEQRIIDLQEIHKDERRRAMQMLQGEGNRARWQQVDRYSTHFKRTMQEETKRQFTPWLLENSIRQQLGS